MNIRILLSLFLTQFALAGLFGPKPAFAVQSTGSIQGTVTIEDGGAPLPGSLVTVEQTGQTVAAGEDGSFINQRCLRRHPPRRGLAPGLPASRR